MNNAEFFDDESGLNDISGRVKNDERCFYDISGHVKNDERGQNNFSNFVTMTFAVQAVFLASSR